MTITITIIVTITLLPLLLPSLLLHVWESAWGDRPGINWLLDKASCHRTKPENYGLGFRV